MSQRGKNKEAELAQDPGSSSNAEGTSSFAGRIGASASGLLQSSFGNQSPGAFTGSLASLTADTAKGGPSNSPGTGETSSSSQAASYRGDDDAPGRSLAGESFRSGQGRGGVSADCGQAAFNEFAASPQALQPDLEPTQKPTASSGWLPIQSFATSDQNKDPIDTWRVSARNEEQPTSGNDGAAVVALLSDPTVNVEEEPTNSWAAEATTRDHDKLGDPRIEQRPRKSVDPLAPVSPLDLMPDFNSSWDSMQASNAFQNSTSYEGQRFSDPSFGDIQPWVDILNRYHNDVWGDMLPLVQEAREEVKAAEASPEGALQDRPALRRLGMLLKHLNQPI
ncbi:hypothetical protein OEA41_010274 [Lepraria neglecta]|uniref:Uncharacterized protein n=1 Tax=Lepraria neglecta TaxID=209136 RepID=A0AAD9YYR2_9LECA|nr:hypothetical protein OEA41_010274 [Lepraria neglecta]